MTDFDRLVIYAFIGWASVALYQIGRAVHVMARASQIRKDKDV